MRFHIPGIAHTATTKDYCACAFTQKVLNLCKMLHSLGHTVIHYGNETSQVDCAEFVKILPIDRIYQPSAFLDYEKDATISSDFNNKVIEEIGKRKEKNDFLLCPWLLHQPIAEAHKDLLIVESGIGYGGPYFAPFRVYESYAIMHANYGNGAVVRADKFRWYDRVIPNYFDPDDFTFCVEKDDYFLFLGTRHGGEGKGVHIAKEVCDKLGFELRTAGPHDPCVSGTNYLGMLNVKERARQLSRASGLFAPSLFLEPFCGAQVEAYLSGTPVLSTDWGAFAEYNIEGVTGYRCHTFREFLAGAVFCKSLDKQLIRNHGLQFTLDKIKYKYEQFFNEIMTVATGRGWYTI